MKKGTSMPPRKLSKWAKRAVEMGAKGARIVPASSIGTGEWVRMKCRFGCGGWNGCLVCPPHSPTPETTARMLKEYRWAVLFERGRGAGRDLATRLEREIFLDGHYKAFGMTSGPCRLCETCEMEKGCRHPEEARPAMEACGIDVFGTVRRNGFEIEVLTSTEQKGHYFGLVLIE